MGVAYGIYLQSHLSKVMEQLGSGVSKSPGPMEGMQKKLAKHRNRRSAVFGERLLLQCWYQQLHSQGSLPR